MQTWLWAPCQSRGAHPQGHILSLAALQGGTGHDFPLSNLRPGSRAGGKGWGESGLWRLANQSGFESSLAAHQHVAVDELLSLHLPRGFLHPALQDCCEAFSCSQGAPWAGSQRTEIILQSLSS